jgi:hypothetical protein
MCEVNFVQSSIITIYNTLCLLWHILHFVPNDNSTQIVKSSFFDVIYVTNKHYTLYIVTMGETTKFTSHMS